MAEKVTVTIELSRDLIEAIKISNESLDLSDDEVENGVREFVDQITEPSGLVTLLEQLDWYNY